MPCLGWMLAPEANVVCRFRYAELRNLNLSATSVEMCVVHSEAEQVGAFSTSNYVINKTAYNVLWAVKANLMSLPSDCPQRDERKGWMGDASLTVDAANYWMDLRLFYENWLDEIAAVQMYYGRETVFSLSSFSLSSFSLSLSLCVFVCVWVVVVFVVHFC